jgi:hypothetical protein
MLTTLGPGQDDREGVVTEGSVLSPGVPPKEPLAQVALLKRSPASSPSRPVAGEEIPLQPDAPHPPTPHRPGNRRQVTPDNTTRRKPCTHAILSTGAATDPRSVSLPGGRSRWVAAYGALRRYGRVYKTVRPRVELVVLRGYATCVRCGELIAPGAEWQLDHRDDGRGWLGPAHARCNLSAAGRKAQLGMRRRSRVW